MARMAGEQGFDQRSAQSSSSPAATAATAASTAPGRATQEQPADPVAAAQIARAREVLIQLGLNDADIGNLAPIGAMSPESLDAALATLRYLRHGSPRVTQAWHQHLDDLGPSSAPTTHHEAYANIVEFAVRLNQRSPGGDYRAYRERMPEVRLAGSRITVNPRAVYFAAAAQVGADERGRDQPGAPQTGAGHWVPTGGFYRMFGDLTRMLRDLGRAPRGGAVAGGVRIYATIYGELQRMLDELAAQDAGRDTPAQRADEHDERGLRALLLPRRAEILNHAPPASDAEVPEVARELLESFGTIPWASVTHEAGATDPHGTSHALGASADLYDGNDGRNMPMPAGAWPFVQYLIQNSAGYRGLTGNERPTDLAAQPAQLRAIAQLVHERGASTYQTLVHLSATDPAERAADRDQRAERGTLRTVRASLQTSLRGRRRALQQAVATHVLPDDDLARAHDELAALDRDLAAVADAGTHDLQQIAQHHTAARAALASVPGADAQAPLDDVLRAIEGAIADHPGLARYADRELRGRVMASLHDPRVLEFLRSAWTRPFYDQSSTLVAAIGDVNGGRVYAGHHWDLLPMAAVGPGADAAAAYQHTLASDVARRTPAQLERILTVMAESAGGRAALFSSPDAELFAALATRLPDVEAVLARIHARVVAPYERQRGQPHDAGGDLRARLRDMGFYLAPPTATPR